MPADPNPLYWIGLKLESSLFGEAAEVTQRLRACDPHNQHRWLAPEELHVTLALPGRPEKPYTKEQIPWIVSQLQEIARRHEPFEVELGNINCFPLALFREVYSPDSSVFSLHHAIADAIPFSEEPRYRYEHFMPHMSLCYLQQVDGHFAKSLDIPRELPRRVMRVSHLTFHTVCDIADIREKAIAKVELASGQLL